MPKAAGKDKEMDGVEKAAILLIALGPEKSAQIFKHLKEDEIEQLTLEIANTSSVSPQTKEMVLNEFYEVCLAQQYIAEGGISYAKELLEKALGEDKAKDAANRAIQCPLLEASISGAKSAIINVTGGASMSAYDASEAVDFIREAAGNDIDIIFGVAINDKIGDSIIVSVIATGFELPKPTTIETDAPARDTQPIIGSKPQSGVVAEEDEDDGLSFTQNFNAAVDDDDDGIPGFFRR